MKKGWIIGILLLLALTLSACAPKEEQKEKKALADTVTAVVKDAKDLVAWSEDDLADLLGILPEDYTEQVYLQGESLSGREIIVIRAKDQEAAGRIADTLNNYLDQRKQETQNYLPDAYKLLSNAKVETKNLTVALVVGESGPAESQAILKDE